MKQPAVPLLESGWARGFGRWWHYFLHGRIVALCSAERPPTTALRDLPAGSPCPRCQARICWGADAPAVETAE